MRADIAMRNTAKGTIAMLRRMRLSLGVSAFCGSRDARASQLAAAPATAVPDSTTAAEPQQRLPVLAASKPLNAYLCSFPRCHPRVAPLRDLLVVIVKVELLQRRPTAICVRRCSGVQMSKQACIHTSSPGMRG